MPARRLDHVSAAKAFVAILENRRKIDPVANSIERTANGTER
jgi:hypothetical protein